MPDTGGLSLVSGWRKFLTSRNSSFSWCPARSTSGIESGPNTQRFGFFRIFFQNGGGPNESEPHTLHATLLGHFHLDRAAPAPRPTGAGRAAVDYRGLRAR